MENKIAFYLNGKLTHVTGNDAFLMLSEYLRKGCALPGTKVVCAEGDCGACSVLIAWPERATNKLHRSAFRMVNACIFPVYQLQGASLVTVEGMALDDKTLHPVQEKLKEHFASQCGYCTPGFVMALAHMSAQTPKRDPQTVKNYCTGNLCRCTGYQSIVDAGTELSDEIGKNLEKRYFTSEIIRTLKKFNKLDLQIKSEVHFFSQPASAKNVSAQLKKKNVHLVGSATDLGVVHNKGKLDLNYVVSLQGIPGSYDMKKSASTTDVGARVDLESLRIFCKKTHPEFSEFLNIFGSPPIRNSATLSGNIATASPIGDTLPYLLNREAELVIAGARTRKVPITSFYKSYKVTDLKSGEWIKNIRIPNLKKSEFIRLYKISQRRDMDISSTSAAISCERSGKTARNFKVALGGVAATPLRIPALEAHLNKNGLTDASLKEASLILDKAIKPLSDHRSSSEYRMLMAKQFLKRFAREFLES